ncbi:MAG: XRE family transcriptional regulator [Comamonadaceae bacterium]|nr:MAG: XRE family transcriptional regulator [Comamonadaceae bacterium]
MSTTADLVSALKKELKAARMTYADLAQSLNMAESSVKRMLTKGDMPLSRIDAICRALKLDFADLARRVADAQPLLAQLSQEQENHQRLPPDRGRMHRLPGATGSHWHH